MQPEPRSEVDAMAEALRAHLDAAERAARAAADFGAAWGYDRGSGIWPATASGHGGPIVVRPAGGMNDKYGEHITLNDPARVLRQVAAHRQLLDDLLAERHRACAAEPEGQGPCSCGRDERVERRVRLLASAYADRDSSDESVRTAP